MKYQILFKLINKSVKLYLSKKIMNMPSETEPTKTKENIQNFKLPLKTSDKS